MALAPHNGPAVPSPLRGSHEALSASVPVQVLGPAVVLDAAAAADVAALVRAGLRAVERLDGITPPPRLRALAEQLRQAVAEVRTPDTTRSADHLIAQTMQVIDTREAAAVLRVSRRHVRRLAPALGGHHGIRGWELDPVAVQAHRIRRQESTHG
jgi:hypothetical protein